MVVKSFLQNNDFRISVVTALKLDNYTKSIPGLEPCSEFCEFCRAANNAFSWLDGQKLRFLVQDIWQVPDTVMRLILSGFGLPRTGVTLISALVWRKIVKSALFISVCVCRHLIFNITILLRLCLWRCMKIYGWNFHVLDKMVMVRIVLKKGRKTE